jgi:cytochrome c biogenesis protein
LALILLGIVALAVVLASFIPQRGQADPETYAAWRLANPFLARILGFLLLDRVYASWWFYVAVSLLLVNTLACTISRIPPLLRQGSRWPRLGEQQIKRLRNWTALETTSPAPEVTAIVGNHLLRRGYRFASETVGNRTFIFARKGDLARWGSILFHFSFLVLASGALFVQLSRYVGIMVITEGQTVTEQRQDYLRTARFPLLGVKHQGFQVRLERFEPTYYRGVVGTDYVAELVILEEGREVRRQKVRVNQPLNYRGLSFVLEKYGFSPLFVLEDATGRELFRGYVNLVLLPPGTKDFFNIPEAGLTVWARLYPDLVMEEGGPATRSLLPRNPVVYLEVKEGKKEVFRGLLPLNGSAVLGDRRLTFADLRYWTQYQVIRDPGKEVIFGGLWLGLIGLTLRYLITPKQIWGLVQEIPRGTRLIIGGTAPQLDSLFSEEFASLERDLRKEGIGGAP